MGFGTVLVGIVNALAWPVAAVIIAIGYKPELTTWLPTFLRRRIGFEGFGVKLNVDAAAEQQAASSAALPEPGTLKEFPGMIRTPAIARLEHDLLTALSKRTDVKSEEKPDLLVRLLAQSQLEAAFERIYNVIFGSQIAGLRVLNSRGRIPFKDAMDFYSVFEAQNPEFYKGYGFNGWLSFLTNNGLVTVHDNLVEITDIGRDFLIWLTAKGRPENKPG